MQQKQQGRAPFLAIPVIQFYILHQLSIQALREAVDIRVRAFQYVSMTGRITMVGCQNAVLRRKYALFLNACQFRKRYSYRYVQQSGWPDFVW